MVFKIIGVFIIITIFAGILFIVYKLNQLKQIEKMNSADLIHYITKEDENIKISIGMIKDGEITYQVFGKNGKERNETNFDYEIGSISKTFVGLIISKAIEEKKIKLKSSISEYLELDNTIYYPTIERLITHTSGYKSYYFDKQMIYNHFHEANDFYGINKSNIQNKAKNIKLKDKDYEFNYSNFGISIIGLVLENVYNKDFITLMNDFIVQDLKLQNTKVALCAGNLSNYWNWKQDDGYIPAGAIISNVKDMTQYLKFYLDNEDNYVKNTYTELKLVNANNFFYEKMDIRIDKIGMTWIMDEKNNMIWHNGGTSHFNSYIAFNKDKNIGVVVLGNISPSKKIPMTVVGAKLMKELASDN